MFGKVEVPFLHKYGRHGVCCHWFEETIAFVASEIPSAAWYNALPRWSKIGFYGARDGDAGAVVPGRFVEDVLS